MKRDVVLCILFLILGAALVLAVGGGGGGGGGGSGRGGDAPEKCENYVTLQNRIECRLRLGETENNVPEETCRPLANSAQCMTYYDDAAPCYTKSSGVAKDQCFKRVAGFSAVAVAMEENKDAVRWYIVLLLYDLQERVEEQYDANRITTEEAGELIRRIIEMKIALLSDESPESVRAPLEEFKQKWEEYM